MSCMSKLCEGAWDIRSFVYKKGNLHKLAGSYEGKHQELYLLSHGRNIFSLFLFYQCVLYVTAPPVTAILCRTFYYTALAAVLTPAFTFPLIGNTLSGLSRPSYVMLGRNMGLSILFPHCLCGLCGAFTKLISCRIYHTHRKISPAAPLYDE